MIDAEKVITYRRDMVHLRRLSGCQFDRDRHREVQLKLLLARERQRRWFKVKPIPPGTSNRIISLVSEVSGISINDILSPRRPRGVAEARMVTAWLLKKYTRNSLPEIGRRLGGKDHTTILRSIRVVGQDIADGGERFGSLLSVAEERIVMGMCRTWTSRATVIC